MDESERDEIKRHMTLLVEQMRAEVRPIAEAVVGLSEKVENLERRMEREFEETRAMIKFSYAELERRISTLESSFANLESRITRLEPH
jgi:uncharacterized protein involved in exopolysaccharide biosynthesis